jgi:hypothetical protein
MEQPESIDIITTEAERNLGMLLDWIGRYDNRASLLFTVDLAMVGTLALILSSSTYLVYDTLFLIAFVLLGISILGTAITIFPHLSGPQDSLLYFGSIAKMEKTNFKNSFIARTKNGYLDDLLAQCHINAKILDLKFKVFRISLAITIIAIIFWSLSLYLN